MMKSQPLIAICKNNDFRRIYNRGKYYVSPAVVIYVLKNRTGGVRVGITASKKTGNAVKRNRSRRIIKEAVRQLLPCLKPGFDYVFVARGKTPFLKSMEIKRNILLQLKNTKFLSADNKV